MNPQRLIFVALCVGTLMAFLDQVLAQNNKTLVVSFGARETKLTLSSYKNTSFAPGNELARALGIEFRVGEGFVLLRQGTRVARLRLVDDAAELDSNLQALEVAGVPKASLAGLRTVDQVLLPVQSITQAFGVQLVAGETIRINAPAVRLSQVPSAKFSTSDRAVLELSGERNYTTSLEGNDLVITVENVRGDDASYKVDGNFIKTVDITFEGSTLQARITLPAGSGFRAYPIATRSNSSPNSSGSSSTDIGRAGIAIDVGPNLERTVPALSTQRTTVVLDPGHGGVDTGLRAGQLLEKTITLEVATRVAALLAEQGVHTVLTRSGDGSVSLDERRQAAFEADVFVSLHLASLTGAQASGAVLYNNVPQDAPPMIEQAREAIDAHDPERVWLERIVSPLKNSRTLAEMISEHLLSQGVKTKVQGFAAPVLRDAPKAALLVELAWMSSSVDRARLANPEARTKLIRGIAEGILAYLKEKR